MGATYQRRHRRYDVAWTVTVQASTWGEVQQFSTSNVSRGGLFVCSESPPPTGTAIETAIRLPDGNRLPLTGVVVHSVNAQQAEETGRLPGFGVQFDQKHAVDLALLEANARANAAGESTYEVSPDRFAIAAELHDGKGLSDERDAQVLPLSDNRSPSARREAGALEATQTDGGSIPVFGIDFGSRFCRIGLVTDRGVRVLQDEVGRAQLPSSVAYVGTTPLVGWESMTIASNCAADAGQCVVVAPKRLIGRRVNDPRMERHLRAASFEVEASANDEILVRAGERRFSLVEVCSEILRKLKDVGEKATGIVPHRVVLSVPYGFSDRQRAALRAAAHLAGLDVVALIDEPVAAAMAHGLGKAEGALIAVYDFGGGSFNCSVLEIRGHKCRVVATGGDPWIGGEAFDQLMAEHAACSYTCPSGESIRKNPGMWTQLLQRCERLKWRLSTSPEETLLPPIFEGEPVGPRLTISRAQLADICGKVVQATIQVMDGCLREAGVEADELDDIMMVGGMSRSPVVRQLLEQHYGRSLELSVLPDEAVVLGNALHGRMIELSTARRAAHCA